MSISINLCSVPELPRLAWVGTLEMGSGKLSVFHGPAVETHDEWIVEGVWDGEYRHGEFHRSENFFGSGIRVDGDHVYFVPSSALVDRLFYCLRKRELIASNSLSLLLGFTGARLDDHCNYNVETRAGMNGIKAYDKNFTVRHPEIDRFYQIYHENVVFDGERISYETRTRRHSIRSFNEYQQKLTEYLRRIRDNYQSNDRRFPMCAFTTISSGYDSPTVSCLAKDIGVKTCFSYQGSNSDLPKWLNKQAGVDDGRPIAEALSLDVVSLEDMAANIPDELYFYTATCAHPELVLHSMATYIEQNCRAAVVFTGYHGDKLWDVHTHGRYLGDEILRNGPSGFALAEIRLKSGFINLAVPFILARDIGDIVRVARSSEMEPWRLNTSYDRPIARRIVESAGVARSLFGVKKKGVVRYHCYPMQPSLRRKYFAFLKQTYGIRPIFVYLHEKCNRAAQLLFKVLATIARPFSSTAYRRIRQRFAVHSGREAQFCWRRIKFNELLFIWSNHVACEEFAQILQAYRKEEPDGIKIDKGRQISTEGLDEAES